MIGIVNSPGVTGAKLNEVKKIAETANSTANSALESVEDAIESGATASVLVSCTLSSGSWTGSEAPYTQEVTVSGLTADSNGIVGLSQDSTESQRNAASYACLAVTGQGDETLTITADGILPTEDIPIAVIIIG